MEKWLIDIAHWHQYQLSFKRHTALDEMTSESKNQNKPTNKSEKTTANVKLINIRYLPPLFPTFHIHRRHSAAKIFKQHFHRLKRNCHSLEYEKLQRRRIFIHRVHVYAICLRRRSVTLQNEM